MARTKSAPAPAAAAAQQQQQRKSAGLKAPSKAAGKKPAAVLVEVAAKRPIKRAPEEGAEKKARKKPSRKARTRALDKHEALAVSGQFGTLERVQVKLRPTQWKTLALEITGGGNARIAAKAALVQGQATLDFVQSVMVDANARKLGEFVHRQAPLPIDDDTATEQEKNIYAKELESYDESKAVFARARLESRIQARHADAAVRAALFQQGGVAAIQQYEAQLGFQTEMDEEDRPAKEARAKEAMVVKKRRERITGLLKLEKDAGLNEDEADELLALQHKEHLLTHKQDLAAKKKYAAYIASAEKAIVEIETEGKKRAAKAIETIQKVTIPDSEAELEQHRQAVTDADVAYESYREEHAKAIFEILVKDRTPEQNKTIKELNKIERAKVRARKEMHEVGRKLVGQKARAIKMVEALPHKDELIAECEARLARNQAKLAKATEDEKASKKQLEKDNRAAKPAKKAAPAAAAASESDDEGSDNESSSDMDESEE